MAKRALLVGINTYRIPGADLRGCVNDVRQMRDLLLELYGFAQSDVSVLTDLDATKSAIQRALDDLVTPARSGDVLFLHYSGHGSNVPDASGDEADFRDEILCPTDLDWRDPLLDDWLRSLFETVTEGANLTVVMDCCHSGTNTRALPPQGSSESRERFLPCPLDLLAVESGRALRGALRGTRERHPAQTDSPDVKDVDMPEVLITGCRDDQTAADAFIDGDYHGALSHSLIDTVRRAKGRLTYRELHSRTARSLADRFIQVPQLEGRPGNLDRLFLSSSR